ncbi:xanthine dehydrogenase subunit XdhA [uncultured Olsenella sp.]|uniref:xanthine dehydrogenase subunit XdhA n=1 Tax=uncultured Olsenella sp. TaxID=190764 RepID=UPI0026DAAB12|nr:xanthine dehydrogenase subunit XdhA [uncultured Olsenella sp.]
MEKLREVGRPLVRVDAYDKVTGRAMYTDDLCPKPCLEARILHSTIGNGVVKSIDISEAQKVPGVVGVFTCFDVPDHPYPVAGHPWYAESKKEKRDLPDRKLLDARVRIYGDNIAAVVAEDTVACDCALAKIKVEYEEYPVVYDPIESMKGTEHPVQEGKPDNIVAHTLAKTDDEKLARLGYSSVEDAVNDPRYHHYKIHMETGEQSQVHIETCTSYCYEENGKIVCVSSTQIPHICRRVIGQALGIPWGDVRVIKPYIGGGFGTKQDIHYEPLNAWLCRQVGGRPVRLELSREELFYATSGRQPKSFDVEAAVDDDMNLRARSIKGWSNTGGYIHHGHALVLNSVNTFRWLYHKQEDAVRCEAWTIHTNGPHTGAMRAYGVPEGNWAAECLMSDIAHDMGWDGVEFRLKNAIYEGYYDEFSPGNYIAAHTCGLPECAEKGKAYIEWDKKRAEYANETGPIRHGVGVSFFVYKTAVAPFALETATAAITLNQDGSFQLQMGATEIGQGADTVFSQMAAEAIGVDTEDVHIVSFQDTDVTPYDAGAYASRQTYVSGTAVKQAGEKLHKQIIDYAHYLYPGAQGEFDLHDHAIWDCVGNKVIDLAELALEAYYNTNHNDQLYARSTANVHTNTIAVGCSFADVTVDMPLGKVTVNKIINIQDSGRLINPKLVEQQVHGGMAQSIGFALYEELLIDPKTARVLNPTLLDYKIPTTMDVPDLEAQFVETDDPTGPYGNKAVGETPIISPAAAIRDAILDATGVKFYEEPMTPQRLFEGFKKEGLI